MNTTKRMKKKTWSYRAITEAAEQQIRTLIQRAGAEAQDDAHSRRLLQTWAYGVFVGWASLTSGWQESGDYDRLEALTRVITPPSAEEPEFLGRGGGQPRR